MTVIAPLALLLLGPFAVLFAICRSPRLNRAAALPGAWARVVAPAFRRLLAVQSHRDPLAHGLTFAVGVLLILALARPGVDLKDPEDFAALGGRVVVIDVGADLARHRQFVEALKRADPATSTAIVAVSDDAYRITPFTTDTAFTNRYVRVLSPEMMPRPGQNPHLGLALAERMLERRGHLVRQVIFLSARDAPGDVVVVPAVGISRILVDLSGGDTWRDWAVAQQAEIIGRDQVDSIAGDFSAGMRAAARSELPDATMELKTFLITLAALLFLFKFRRRAA